MRFAKQNKNYILGWDASAYLLPRVPSLRVESHRTIKRRIYLAQEQPIPRSVTTLRTPLEFLIVTQGRSPTALLLLLLLLLLFMLLLLLLLLWRLPGKPLFSTPLEKLVA